MRSPNQAARQQIAAALRRGPISAPALAEVLVISPRTVLRLIGELGERVVSMGAAGRRRYALARPLRGDARPIPVFAVDRRGSVHDAGTIQLVDPGGSTFDLATLGWPVDTSARDGWWQGLPYPLYDMRPQGFIGRAFARLEHRALEVASDPRAWGDDDIAYVLSRRSADVPGSLIVGEPALRLHQAQRALAAAPIKPAALTDAYPALAEAAIGHAVPGSSAAGEFPKFTATRTMTAARTPHVIVKFSGQAGGDATQRWSDLAVCEHLALEQIDEVGGLQAARSRIIQARQRTFFESERFDRHGLFGRSPVVSLEAINGHLLGLASGDWRDHAAALLRLKLIDESTARSLVLLWWYGRLIANSDMHLGNLSLIPADGALRLAPVYDMLPMGYAPLPGGEVTRAPWSFELPLPREARVWTQACTAAIAFWRTAATDARISSRFRSLCNQNAGELERCAERL